MPRKPGPTPMAVTSSLNSVYISPRTPKTPRVTNEDEESDVELELLNDQQRLEADRDVDTLVEHHDAAKRPISAKDKRSMVLLCVLCMCQNANSCSLI